MKYISTALKCFGIVCLWMTLSATGFSKSAIDLFDLGCNADDPNKKIRYFTGALEKDPLLFLAFKNRALAYESLSNNVHALSDWTALLQLKPNQFDGYFFRGNLYEKLGKMNEALFDFKKALEIDSSNLDTLARIAKLEEQMGDKNSADERHKQIALITHASSSEEISPPKTTVPGTKITVDPLHTAKKQGAVKGSPKQDKPPVTKEADKKKDTTVSQPKVASKEVVTQPVEKRHPQQPRKKSKEDVADEHLLMGDELRWKGQFIEAIKQYELALSAVPDLAIAKGKLAQIYSDKGQYQTSLDLWNEAVKMNPKVASFYNERGKVKKWLGIQNEAMADYTQATKLDPNLADAWYNMGWIYYNRAQFKDAIEFYSKAIALNPKFASAYNARGWAKEDLGDLQGAEDDFNKHREVTLAMF